MREILFEGVSSQYRKSEKEQLQNLNFKITEGELTLLAGPSGSGKSTLVLLLNGIIPHHTRAKVSGSMNVFGKNPLETTVLDMSNTIGMLLQDPDSQLATSRVKDEIILTLEFQGKTPEEIDIIVEKMLTKFDIIDLSDHDSTRMSGGEKQLVALAAMMSRDPSIIILDEPTSNLDPVNTVKVLNHIQKFKEEGKTVILIEHKINEVFEHCPPDKIMLMSDGKIIAHKAPSEILYDPVNYIESIGLSKPYIYNYIKQSNLLKSDNSGPSSIVEFKEFLKTLNQIQIMQLKKVLSSPERLDLNSQQQLLEFTSVDFKYRNQQKKALKLVNLTVNKGEFIAIVGNNGSGKSTLVKHIIGLNRPTDGSVVVDERNTKKTTAARLAPTVSFLFQNPDNQLFASSVRKEVIYAPMNCGMSKFEANERAEIAINSVKLSEYASTNPLKLSMGQKQRVAVASALAMNPKIIVLDEPTTGQDPTSLKGIMELMLHEYQNDVTIIMVTHDMNLVDSIANRTVVLSQGEILLDDRTDKVFLEKSVMRQANLEPPTRVRMLNIIDSLTS
ncbi:MAG: energy-coupling factor ABC transporter ATP-binding protein [Candidatus Heimdallarchaeota archaeon]|nr:energy-coupling factor ABC transporter ATP-binding protein [Candidatus Heimdallarchaeota archaeon]